MTNNDKDKELEDLLDTVLEDFDKSFDLNSTENISLLKIEKTSVLVEEIKCENDPKTSVTSSSKNQLDQSEMELFEKIFNDDKTLDSMKQFKDTLKVFGLSSDLIDDKNIFENFEKIMSELNNVDDGDDIDPENNLDAFKNFSKSSLEKRCETLNLYEDDIDEEDRKPATSLFNKVLDDLNKNTEKVFNNRTSLNSFFSSKLNFSVGEDDDDDDLIMEPILSMIFSKDVLYPSLRLMSENYDKYLAEKKEILNEQELNKCKIQKECIQEMCQIYENSKDTDLKENKSEQLKKILDLLEKCGMPPNELVPEVNPFEMLDENIKQNNFPKKN